jgi:soluble lytic murein transglycosylase-like protein
VKYLFILSAVAFGQQDPMRRALEQQKAAIVVQRNAVRKQVAAAEKWLTTWDPSWEPPACDPIDDGVVSPLIDTAAKAQQLDPKLLRAVIEQESGFRPCAISPNGAMGLMQLMPATADLLSVQHPFDPKESIDAGAKYLKQMMDRYKGDLAQALGAYNAGPTTVDQSGSVPDIRETQNYVDSILQKLGLTRTGQPRSPTPKPTGN